MDRRVERRTIFRWLGFAGIGAVALAAAGPRVIAGIADLMSASASTRTNANTHRGQHNFWKEGYAVGTMPFHLEKGVIGMRMDYLTRHSEVRDHVLKRLVNGENPIAVARSISVGQVTIDVFNDKKGEFAAKLDAVFWPGAGEDYLIKQNDKLRPRNQDTTGNRQAFTRYWIKSIRDYPDLIEVLRQELIVALSSGREIDYWWECSLMGGSKPTVKTSLELPEVARVLFRTDMSVVETPDDLPAREPFDT